MPSGAKKRKAAKKKKEKQAHTTNNNNNNPHENDDRRSQDERDSDGGDVGSPMSGDHDNQSNPFHEGNGESGKRDPSPLRSFVAENKSMEEVSAEEEGAPARQVGQEDDGIVKIERDFKTDNDSERKNVSIEHVEFAKESHGRDNGSSGSSSSDDESRVFVKKLEDKPYNSDLEATLHHNEANSTGSLSEEVTPVPANATYVETNNNLVVEPAPPVVYDVMSLVPVSEEFVEFEEGASVENSVVSDVIGSVSKENVEKLLPTSYEGTGVSLASTDVISKEKNENKVFLLSDEATTEIVPKKNNEDKVFPISDENVLPSSNVVGSSGAPINGNGGRILTSSGAPIAGTSNGAENIKDPGIPECSENEPLVAPAPRMVQRTSFLSCCGLFDVITGSGR